MNYNAAAIRVELLKSPSRNQSVTDLGNALAAKRRVTRLCHSQYSRFALRCPGWRVPFSCVNAEACLVIWPSV